MRCTAPVVSVLLLTCVLSSVSSAESAVSPASFANAEAETESLLWTDASRGMSIYDSSVFDAPPDRPIRITSFNLRPDGRHPVGAQFGFDNLKLLFAVTPVAPADMSPVFERNVREATTDPIAVFDQEWLVEVLNSDPPGPDTRPFDFKIPLSNPFEFDPDDGNLLVDWVFGSPIPEQSSFDRSGLEFPDDQFTYWQSGVNPTAGGGSFSVVTQFEFKIVPEPTFGLNTVVLISLGLLSRHRRRRTTLLGAE